MADVGRSMAWYVTAFGLEPEPFPKDPPHSFAILRRDDAEMMLQAGESARPRGGKEEG